MGKTARAPFRGLGSKAHQRVAVHGTHAACAGQGLGTWRGRGGAGPDNRPTDHEEALSAGGLGLQRSEGRGLAPAPARRCLLPGRALGRAGTRLSHTVFPTHCSVAAPATTTTATSMSPTRKRRLCFRLCRKKSSRMWAAEAKCPQRQDYRPAAGAGDGLGQTPQQNTGTET